MLKEMKKNELQSLMLIALLTCIGLTTSFIFKRCSKLQIEQPCNGTINVINRWDISCKFLSEA